jgi:hypothetical protein
LEEIPWHQIHPRKTPKPKWTSNDLGLPLSRPIAGRCWEGWAASDKSITKHVTVERRPISYRNQYLIFSFPPNLCSIANYQADSTTQTEVSLWLVWTAPIKKFFFWLTPYSKIQSQDLARNEWDWFVFCWLSVWLAWTAPIKKFFSDWPTIQKYKVIRIRLKMSWSGIHTDSSVCLDQQAKFLSIVNWDGLFQYVLIQTNLIGYLFINMQYEFLVYHQVDLVWDDEKDEQKQ